MNLNIFGFSPGFVTMVLDAISPGSTLNIYENQPPEDKFPVDEINFKLIRKNYTGKEIIKGDCFLGAGTPEAKRNLFRLFGKEEHKFIVLKAPGVVFSVSSKTGIGCFIGPNSVVAGQTVLGNFVTLNRMVAIGHHTTIGDFVTINPSASIAGKVEIGEGTTIGMGAKIINNIKIGKNCLIGAGSVVTRDVEDNMLFVGTRENAKALPRK